MSVFYGERFAVLALGNNLAFGVFYNNFNFALAAYVCVNFNRAFLVSLGGDGYAGRTEKIKVKVVFVNCDEVYVAVYAAVKCKVCRLGVYFLRLAVVNVNKQLVVRFKQVGYVCAEGGVAAVVRAYLFFVEQNARGGVDALEFKVNSFVLAFCGCGKVLYEKADAPVIVAAAVLTVLTVPGKGKVELNAFGNVGLIGCHVRLYKFPVGVDVDYCSHYSPPMHSALRICFIHLVI